MGRDKDNLFRWRTAHYKANRDEINQKRRAWRSKRIASLSGRKQVRAQRAAYYKAHDKPYHEARTKRYRRKLKTGVIQAYGGQCSCCGEKESDFLTVEHVNGDGKMHRASVVSVYRDLRNKGYPRGDYTVLCFNCNIAKSLFGTCPHQRKGGTNGTPQVG